MNFLRSLVRVSALTLIILLLVIPTVYTIKIVKEIKDTKTKLEKLYNYQIQDFLNQLNTESINRAVIDELIRLNKKLEKETLKPSYDYLTSVTVFIFQRSIESEEHGSVGTGVIVKNTDGSSYILTNKHVCDKNGMTCVVVSKEGGKIVQIPVYLYKEAEGEHDAQILISQVPIPGKQAIRGLSEAKPQDAVFLVGHHLGRPYVYGEGVFAGYDAEGTDIIQVPTLFGDSGSGVFNREGKLVGLVYAISGYSVGILPAVDNGHGLIVNIAILRDLLKGLIPIE
jgi:S1-C subfamily serine protease